MIMSPSGRPNTLQAERTGKARSTKPRLYAELESMVLDTFQDIRNPQDLTWLWVGGRHVSKHFRCEVERIFRMKIMPEMILCCDMGKPLRRGSSIEHAATCRDSADVSIGFHLMCWDIFTSSNSPDCYAGCDTSMSSVRNYAMPRFTFDRFSDDQTRAYFKHGEYKAGGGYVFRRIFEKQLVGDPIFSIQIREVVNDTGLPGLQIDEEKGEISFDWRGMLDRLLGEEHVFHTILSQRLGWHLDSGEETPNLLETHRKLARRSRFQRECRAEHGSNVLDQFVRDETQALETLRRLRRVASQQKNSNTHGGHMNNPLVYDRQKILDELPNNAIIYSGNSVAEPRPGSISRGILTSRDYCWVGNQRSLPSPSTIDLFSPRPLPELSWGRRVLHLYPQETFKQETGKRARKENPRMPPKKRGKNATD